MRVTVVFEEGKINVDGVAKFGFDLSSYDPNWRVLQWRGTSGWIELNQGGTEWLSDSELADSFKALYDVAE